MKKNLIIGIVIGILIAVCAYHVYALYTLRKIVYADHATTQSIVDLINNSIAAQKK